MERVLEEMLVYYNDNKFNMSTINSAKRTVNILISIGINETAYLNDDAIRRFEAALPASVTSRRRWGFFMKFQAICNWCVKQDYLKSCPDFPPIPQPREFPRVRNEEPLTPEDVKAIWDYLQVRACSWEGNRVFALFAVVVLAGIRKDEALRLVTADVDLVGGVLWIHKRAARPRTSLPARVRMSGDLKMVLAGWLRQIHCEWVFPGKRQVGVWQGSDGLDTNAEIKAAARALGITKEVTFSSLRRFHIENSITTVPLDEGRARPRRKTPAVDDDDTGLISTGESIPAVEMKGPGHPVLVRGVPKRLTSAEYRIVMLLLQAWDDGGLSLKGMNRLYGKKTWRQLLIRLRKDPDWFAAIGFPGPRKKGGSDLYRILPA
jgi:integrase